MSGPLLPQIRVDDTDKGIKYIGDWFADAFAQTEDGWGNFGTTWGHTIHGTKSSGSFFYNFSGTHMVVYGSNSITNTSGVIDPSYQCLVDGAPISSQVPNPRQQNNWQFCSGDFRDGPHVLAVNATSTNGNPFLFDYLSYIPSETVSLETATVALDQSDPSIQYSPGWISGPPASTKLTSVTGAYAYLEFQGVGLTLIGLTPSLSIYPNKQSSGTYKIDGGSEVQFTLKALKSDTAPTNHHQTLFQITGLAPTRHNITITYRGDNTTTPLAVNTIIVQHSPESAAGVVSPKSSNPGPIIGGVLGGLGLILLVSLVLFVVKKRKRWGASNVEEGLIPYTQVDDREPVVSRKVQPLVEPLTREQGKRGRNVEGGSSTDSSPRPQTPSASVQQLSTETTQTTLESRVFRHEDSGIRVPEAPSNVVELPPFYTPV